MGKAPIAAGPLEASVGPTEVDAAKERLLAALPYFRKAVSDAKKKGAVQLGVLATNPDGSGNIEVRFEASEFFDDLATVLGAPPQTEEDDMKAKALAFLQRHGLTPNAEVTGLGRNRSNDEQ